MLQLKPSDNNENSYELKGEASPEGDDEVDTTLTKTMLHGVVLISVEQHCKLKAPCYK